MITQYLFADKKRGNYSFFLVNVGISEILG